MDFSHLMGFDVAMFLGGNKGVSGTDSTFIRVVNGLASNGSNLTLFAKGSLEPGNIATRYTTGVEEATDIAIKEHFDCLVFVYKEYQEVINAIQLANRSSLKMIVWAHNPIGHVYLDLFAHSPSILHIVYVEQFDANHIRHHKAFQKALVIPNGIEEEVYARLPSSNSKSSQVCFLGSISYSKGFHHLAKAWPTIRKQVPDATLLILGSGKLYDNRAKLGPLQLGEESYEKEYIMPFLGKNETELFENGVRRMGLVTRNDLLMILTHCKVVCINPNTEGSLESCSVSSLEAQMIGVPIVAGKAGGNLCTILQGKTGFLVTQGELPHAVVKLLKNEELRIRMGNNAKKWATTHYELESILQKWELYFYQPENKWASLKPRLSKNILSFKIIVKTVVGMLKGYRPNGILNT